MKSKSRRRDISTESRTSSAASETLPPTPAEALNHARSALESLERLHLAAQSGLSSAVALLHAAVHLAVLRLLDLVLSGNESAVEEIQSSPNWPVLFHFDSQEQAFHFRRELLPALKKLGAGRAAYKQPRRETSKGPATLAMELYLDTILTSKRAVSRCDVNKLFAASWKRVVGEKENGLGVRIESIPFYADGAKGQRSRYAQRKKEERGDHYKSKDHAKTDASNVRARIKANVKRHFVELIKWSASTPASSSRSKASN